MHFKEFIGKGKIEGGCLRGKLQEVDLVQLAAKDLTAVCRVGIESQD